jgi:mannose-6-phosphate isomerase-like protein (cupin superfamily)
VSSLRRVITGVDEAGESVFVSDEQLEGVFPPLLEGNEVFNVFGENAVPTVPHAGEATPGLRFFPPVPGSYRFVIFTYPPESEKTEPGEFDAALAETERLTPGMSEAVTDAAGMHYSATVDLEYVLAGEFTLTLPNGESKVLKAGDALVQCGPKHSWANTGDVPATMLLVFVGANLDVDRFNEAERA